MVRIGTEERGVEAYAAGALRGVDDFADADKRSGDARSREEDPGSTIIVRYGTREGSSSGLLYSTGSDR